MRIHFLVGTLFVVILTSCDSDNTSNKNGKNINDSASKAQQRILTDSLKKANPLLILPPDSVYTGDYVDKYPNGIIKFRGQFRFGQRHGQWMSFYPNGEAWSEMHYDKGLREGPNITYYENGKTRYIGHFKNDQQDSVWLYFDEAGKRAKRVLYKEDRIVKNLSLE